MESMFPGDELSGSQKKSISEISGALESGLLKIIVCLPNSEGEYNPYRETLEPVTSDPSTSISSIDFKFWRTDCPKYRKCSECPNNVGMVATASLKSGIF